MQILIYHLALAWHYQEILPLTTNSVIEVDMKIYEDLYEDLGNIHENLRNIIE